MCSVKSLFPKCKPRSIHTKLRYEVHGRTILCFPGACRLLLAFLLASAFDQALAGCAHNSAIFPFPWLFLPVSLPGTRRGVPSPRASAKSQRRIRLTLSASLYWDPQRPFPLSVRPPQRMMPRNARFVIVDLHNDVVAAAGCLTGLYRYYSPGSSWVQTVGPLFPEEGPVMNWRRSADSLMEGTIEDRGGCCVFCALCSVLCVVCPRQEETVPV